MIFSQCFSGKMYGFILFRTDFGFDRNEIQKIPGFSVELIRTWRRRGVSKLDAFYGVARARKLGISPQPLVRLE